MGMAWNAPVKRQQRIRYVSDHALARFRERIAHVEELLAQGDLELGNRLDEVVNRAVMAGRVQCSNGVALLVDLREEVADLWAVIRPNLEDRKGAPKEAIATLLTTAMVKKFDTDDES